MAPEGDIVPQTDVSHLRPRQGAWRVVHRGFFGGTVRPEGNRPWAHQWWVCGENARKQSR